LSTVRKADKIFVLKDGTIYEQGTHEELLKKEGGLYKHLHELQMGVRNVISSPNVDIEKVMNNLN